MDFLIMEYLQGDTLERRLKNGPLPVGQALTYGIEIASALAAAHQAGIVHRDLKPANIILTATGAKLLDFGLAKPAPQAASDSTATAEITGSKTLIGTAPYITFVRESAAMPAPESVPMRVHDPRPRPSKPLPRSGA